MQDSYRATAKAVNETQRSLPTDCGVSLHSLGWGEALGHNNNNNHPAYYYYYYYYYYYNKSFFLVLWFA